jgi:hypothetical protein
MSTTEITLIHRLRLADAEHSLLSTITTFGTAADLTVEELSIEAFDPADRRTAEALHEIDRTEHEPAATWMRPARPA